MPEQAFDSRRVVETRQLNQDHIFALTLNRRLTGAGFVDAAADDLDRLLDRGAAAFGNGFFGERDFGDALSVYVDVKVLRADAEERI